MNEEDDQRRSDRRVFLLRIGFSSFGESMIGPYIGVYAVQLGATPAEMGWLRSLQQFSGSTMQLA